MPHRVPSPRELAMHTQTIIQNALIKKKLEEQRENFRKRQEQQQHHQQKHHSHQNTASPVNSPAKQTQSPTPLAFTPTSVLRKMTAEKEPEGANKFFKIIISPASASFSKSIFVNAGNVTPQTPPHFSHKNISSMGKKTSAKLEKCIEIRQNVGLTNRISPKKKTPKAKCVRTPLTGSNSNNEDIKGNEESPSETIQDSGSSNLTSSESKSETKDVVSDPKDLGSDLKISDSDPTIFNSDKKSLESDPIVLNPKQVLNYQLKLFSEVTKTVLDSNKNMLDSAPTIDIMVTNSEFHSNTEIIELNSLTSSVVKHDFSFALQVSDSDSNSEMSGTDPKTSASKSQSSDFNFKKSDSDSKVLDSDSKSSVSSSMETIINPVIVDDSFKANVQEEIPKIENRVMIYEPKHLALQTNNATQNFLVKEHVD